AEVGLPDPPGPGPVLLLQRPDPAGHRAVAEGGSDVQGRRDLPEPGPRAVAGRPDARSQAGGPAGAGQGHQEARGRPQDHQHEITPFRDAPRPRHRAAVLVYAWRFMRFSPCITEPPGSSLTIEPLAQ